jgi:hypothetical protein
MSRATLSPPRTRSGRAAPAAPPPDPGPPLRGRATGRTLRDERERRILWAAIAASVLFHIVVLVAVPFSPGFRPVPTGPAPLSEPEQEPGLRLLQFEAVDRDVEELEGPDDPERTPGPARAPAPAAPAPPGEPAADRLSAADRLRPGAVRDPRLWRDHGPAYLLPPETPEEAILRGLLPRLALLNDSAAAEEDRRRRATDWTFTDSEGRRWGISSEGIHLGGITLPAVEFSADPEQRRAVEAALREWSEIRDQAYRAGLDEGFEERVRAIRERVERERAEREEGG